MMFGMPLRRAFASLALLCAVTPNPLTMSSSGTITVELYKGRAYGDPRPYGTAIGSTTFSTSALGAASYSGSSVTPPTLDSPLDLLPLGASLEPGESYTMVMTMSGAGTVHARTVPLASATDSRVAVKTSGASDWSLMALALPSFVNGTQEYSQTTETETIKQVTMTITLDDGSVIKRSIAVAGQVAVTNPWLGVIPGETQSLEQDGL
jgi:hypothetical protein